MKCGEVVPPFAVPTCTLQAVQPFGPGTAFWGTNYLVSELHHFCSSNGLGSVVERRTYTFTLHVLDIPFFALVPLDVGVDGHRVMGVR